MPNSGVSPNVLIQMEIKKILISQPRPLTEKSPYFDIERRFGVEMTFKPFIQVVDLTPKEFRLQKVSISNFNAIVLTSKTAADHFFSLADELRVRLPEDIQYFCLNEHIANYLQKFIVYRKRKIHFSKEANLEDLSLVMKRHSSEMRFLMPVADVHKEDLSIFTKAKVQLTTAVMYRTVSSQIPPEEIASYDMLCFFTPAGIQSLFENDPAYRQGDQAIAVFGPSTLRRAEEMGLRVDVPAPTPEIPSMASAIQKYLLDHEED